MGGIFVSLLLVFSIFTLLSISEVNAEQVISVKATGYENTIIIELENESTYKINTVRVWPGGEVIFESFKSEPGWGGGKYSDGQLVIFTATNALNPGESIKFGLVTNEKIDGINWKALDLNNNDIDSGKVSIQAISETSSDLIEEESKEVEQAKETGSELYGTKKFIPETIRVGSDVRLVGSGFNSGENFKLYLDNTIVKSVNTDQQGNFLTTISIDDTYDVGTSEFIIKDESGNIQSSNINIEESKNRFLKTTEFEVANIPAEVRYDETLTISGSAYPQSAIILSFEDMNRVLEKTRVTVADSNGEWIFEETINRAENLGEKYVIIQNNNNKTTKNLNIKSDYLLQITTAAVRHSSGDTVSITGSGEPSKNTTIWIKDDGGKIIHYDVFTSEPNGELNYAFMTDDTISVGTYTAIVRQENGSDAVLFGIGQYPSTSIITLMEKTNFSLNSKAVLSIIGPASSKLSIKILDSNDNIEMTDSITTSSTGKSKYAINLEGLSSGIYKAVVGQTNIQDSVKFSIGLEPGSGEISLLSIKENYSPGDSILVLGNTGSDARLTVTLYEPSGKVSSATETFSDTTGNFATNDIGIPTSGDLGIWKLTAHSRLDTKSIDIVVSLPAEKGITLNIEGTEFTTGQILMIKGVAQSDTSRLVIEITNEDDTILNTLETPITSDGTYMIPWVIPTNFEIGTYTITVKDAENSASMEIFIQ
jgi:archaellum component FlaF (FlaF/FlaG flagellin family)